MFAVHVGKVDGGLCPVSLDGFFSMRREALDAGLADAASSVMPVSEAV
jgi:hypothetical protein